MELRTATLSTPVLKGAFRLEKRFFDETERRISPVKK